MADRLRSKPWEDSAVHAHGRRTPNRPGLVTSISVPRPREAVTATDDAQPCGHILGSAFGMKTSTAPSDTPRRRRFEGHSGYTSPTISQLVTPRLNSVRESVF